jgi:hypothetical protein
MAIEIDVGETDVGDAAHLGQSPVHAQAAAAHFVEHVA